MRTQRSIYNFMGGMANQLITVILGIVLPRLVLLYLGSESNGLMSTIDQVFSYINLLEAGIGIAAVQALYQPIALNDRSSINGILSATNQYYHKTGWYYFLALGMFAGLYPMLAAQTSYSYWVVSGIILFTGLNTFLSFLFHGKYRILLEAEGKLYIITNINSAIIICNSVIKALLLINGFDLLTIQILYFGVYFTQLVFLELYIHRKYQWINLSVKPNVKAIAQKNSVLIHQISSVIFANTDILILSVFAGFKVVSVYALYQLVIGTITTALQQVTNSIRFAFGQVYFVNKKRYKQLLNAFETYYNAMSCAIFTVAFILILPFISMYTSGVTDIAYVDRLLAILFIAKEIIIVGRIGCQNSIDVAGHFDKTKYRSLLETAINLFVSFALIIPFGIYGVLIGTIVAVFYRTNDMIIYAHRHILEDSVKKSYIHWLLNIGLMIGISLFALTLDLYPTSILSFITTGFLLSLVVFPTFFVINSVVDRSAFRELITMITK